MMSRANPHFNDVEIETNPVHVDEASNIRRIAILGIIVLVSSCVMLITVLPVALLTRTQLVSASQSTLSGTTSSSSIFGTSAATTAASSRAPTTRPPAVYDASWDGSQYLNRFDVVPGVYELYWTVADGQQINFAVRARVSGWIGLGLAQVEGRMTGSDVMLAWFDAVSGALQVDDTKALYQTTPFSDVDVGGSFSFSSMSGSRNATTGIMTVKWSRLLDTGDSVSDQIIYTDQGTSTSFIYAFGSSQEPTDHGPGNHGAFSLELYQAVVWTSPSSSSTSTALSANTTTTTRTTAGTSTTAAPSGTTSTSASTSTSTTIPAPSSSWNDTQYSNRLNVVPGVYELYWTVEAQQVHFAIRAQATGWVGLGVAQSAEGRMIGSDVMMASFDASGVLQVIDATARSQAMPLSDVNVGGSFSFSSVSGARNASGGMFVKWSRLLDTGDAVGDNIIFAERATTFTYAFGPSSSPVDHGPFNRGAFAVQLYRAGSVVVVSVSQSNVLFAHGILMLIAFALFFPMAVLLAVAVPKSYGWWLLAHAGSILVGASVVAASFALVLYAVSSAGGNHFNLSSRSAGAHAVLGVMMIFLVICQILIGVWVNYSWNQSFKSSSVASSSSSWIDRLHWWIGRIVLLLSICVVFLGFFESAWSWICYLCYAVWICVVGTLLVVAMRKRYQRERTM